MRDRGKGGDKAPKRRRPPRSTVPRNVFESPVGPPPKRRAPTRRDRQEHAAVERTLLHATRTGRALSPTESRRAVSKYGFLAANMIEIGLRKLALEPLRQTNIRQGHSADLSGLYRKPGLTGRILSAGLMSPGTPVGRAVNLLTSIPREAAGIGIGLGQLAGRAGYDVSVDVKNLATERDPSFRHTRETAGALAEGVAADYRARYGSGFQSELEQRGPLPYLLDLVGGAGALTRAGSIARGAGEARATGLSPLESIRQGYRKSINPIDPRLAAPGRARILPLGERDVPLSWSRSPMGRHFQELYDDYSLKHPTRARTGANARAGKRAVRIERQQERRVRVAQARNMRSVRHPGARFRGSKAADIRLFWESQLPEAFRGNEGLGAVRDYLDRQRNSPRRVRDLEPTARLLSARAKHEKLLTRYERAVGKNKQRIRKELDKADADMRAAEDSVAVISRRKEELERDPQAAVTKARTRLQQLNAELETLVDAIEKDMKDAMGGKFDPAETMRRTKYKQEATGKKGPRARARARLEETRTQAQELRADAWRALQEWDSPTVQKMLEEHDQLRDLIDEHDEKHLFRESTESTKIPESTEDIPANLGRGKYGTEAGRLGGALSVAADDLQALESRHLTRIGQSRTQLVHNLGELNKRIARAGRGTKTREELEERAARLQATIDQADQFHAARGFLRHEQLSRRIDELEQAMEHAPDERYHAALAGAAAITADLEKITGDILGPEKIGLLEQRRGLLGRMIGLDDAEPSDIFAPHRETRTGGRIQDTSGIGAPSGRRIAGKASTTNLGLRKQNRGVLVDTGRVDPNLDHLVVQWGRAQSYRFVQNIRDLMYDAGEEIQVGGVPRSGWYVVDRTSRVNERLWDNAELGDDEALVSSLEDYVNDSIWKEGERLPDTYEGRRQVDPSVVEAIFKEAGVDLPTKTGRRRQAMLTVGSSFDVVNGLVRTSLLYANPGYYPANFIGNLIFMGLHQHGFAIPNVYRAGKMYFDDRELFDGISGEVGMGPTEALSAKTSVGGGRVDQALNLERRATHVAAAIPDNWPRVAAWIYEARNQGFKTPEAMRDLLAGTSEQSKVLRQQVSDRAVEAMVNFERTSPLERATLGRVFFVWPWIRGAAAWTTHYMTEYPERAAVLAPVAAEEHRSDAEIMGPVPAYLRNLVPLDMFGKRVLNVGSVSPSATAAELIETFSGTINAVAGNEPPPKYNGIGDMINPLLDFAWYTLHSQTSFGDTVGMQTAIKRNALELSPFASTIAEATGRKPVSKIYSDDDARSVLERRFGRVIPFDVDRAALAERAAQDQPGPAETPQSRMDDYIGRVRNLIGEPPESIRRARRNQMLYEQAVDTYKEKKYGSSRHKMTVREEAAVLLGVDASQRPGVWDPASLTKAQQIIRDGPPAAVRAFIRNDRNVLWESLLGPLSSRLGDAARAREAREYARSHGG